MVVLQGGWGFRLITVITLTAGTAFIMWLGEQITEHGIGNGISLIIFAGIVAGMPNGFVSTMRLLQAGEMSIFIALLLLITMVLVVAVHHLHGTRPAAHSRSVRQDESWAGGSMAARTRISL